MLILEANNIKKFFGDRLILDFEGLKVYSGDKIGIVGRNGAGKTTLLNILKGDIKPDEGIVKRHCDIAYIKQFGDNQYNIDAKTLKEFGVKDKNTEGISGGERTRLNIAQAIGNGYPMIFADEPTSNLDLKGVELLKSKLDNADSLIIISHDRALMDSICNKIIEVDDGEISFYEGNFSAYQLQKEEELERQSFEYEAYVDEKEHLKAAIADRANRAKSVKAAPKRMCIKEARLHKCKSKAKQKKLNNATNMIKTRLEKLEIKEKPKEFQQIKLDFSLTNPPQNKIVISSDSLSFSYMNETECRTILSETKFSILNGAKYAILGENGVGKTTLLNQIFNRNEAVRIVPKANLGYFRQGFENLNKAKSILENVMQDSVQTETTVRTILARLLFFEDDVYKKVAVLSGGELIKVSFAKLFVSDSNVLLLDEPTNYLDMQSIQALEDILSDYSGTVLFVSHDARFVEHIADRLLILENKKITEFEGKYQQYIAKKNSLDPQRILMQMRVSEILAKLSQQGSDRQMLEEEYERLMVILKDS